jgi:signal transduction histidine kinase
MQIAAATGNEVLGEEYQVVRSDGSAIDILSFAAPLFDEHGRVRGVLHVCVDISERKAQEQLRRELEQDLQRALRMKSLGAMAAGIAHDFNNLLTSIMGQASLAADGLPPNSRERQHIAASLKSAEQAARLIAKVLAFTGHSFHTLRPTDLGLLLTTCHAELAAVAAPKAEVRLSIASQLPPVMADQNEIRHILHNLVLNAIEATVAEHGTIQACVDLYQVASEERNLARPGEELAPGTYVRIMVRDSGSGMPAEIAEQAFDPFFSTKFLGRGMGLAEVLGIMRAHNGAVRLETVPDEGTSVILFFPASEKSASRAA